mmetsp:Transcript_22056/g.65036  ORF Transcript_22056/g.65036 Transcript_22056/m.65036 type:complete len:322 (+) Transcript_22056:223-1188(+)
MVATAVLNALAVLAAVLPRGSIDRRKFQESRHVYALVMLLAFTNAHLVEFLPFNRRAIANSRVNVHFPSYWLYSLALMCTSFEDVAQLCVQMPYVACTGASNIAILSITFSIGALLHRLLASAPNFCADEPGDDEEKLATGDSSSAAPRPQAVSAARRPAPQPQAMPAAGRPAEAPFPATDQQLEALAAKVRVAGGAPDARWALMRLEKAEWKETGLNDQDAVAVAHLVAHSTALTHLDLDTNPGLGRAGVDSIARALEASTRLQTLHLSYNKISDVSAIGRALEKNTALQRLYLGGNELSESSKASVRAAWGNRGGDLSV